MSTQTGDGDVVNVGGSDGFNEFQTGANELETLNDGLLSFWNECYEPHMPVLWGW